MNSCLERQEAEIALLEAMYPDQATWHSGRSELQYRSVSGGSLILRLPARYPESEKPIVLSAVNEHKDDLSTQTKATLDQMNAVMGDEALDAIVQAFEDLQERCANSSKGKDVSKYTKATSRQEAYKSVIVWLHHLLNTNKRKLATHPSTAGAKVGGVTKPGYPGVMVFSGPVDDVDLHVADLKSQRWQAFQVRFDVECPKPWSFVHGPGIKEVESMSEISQAISEVENREAFLKAIHIK